MVVGGIQIMGGSLGADLQPSGPVRSIKAGCINNLSCWNPCNLFSSFGGIVLNIVLQLLDSVDPVLTEFLVMEPFFENAQ